MSTCGYNGSYLSVQSINNLVGIMDFLYPGFCQIITLESSREGRPIRAIKIGKGSSATRRGLLLVGGIHARELLNPDALLQFAFRLAYAYKFNKNLILGGITYGNWLAKVLVENMDIFVLPLANPDGRAYVLDPSGDRMWRGNRGVNPGSSCIGVDVNRNFDFLWSSNLNASSNPCSPSQIYKGPAAFSEPETRNVRRLLDSYPHIAAMVDVHSYSEYVIYPWSDDESQTTNTSMRFSNPAFDGQRGTKGDPYQEYIPKADLDWFVWTANRMEQAIAAVRGRNYSVIPGVDVYSSGISGTSNDYSFSRHFVDATKRKVLAFAIESGPLVKKPDGNPDYLHSFQPLFPEAGCIMDEIQPAFIELSLGVLCGASELFESLQAAASMVNASARRAARPSPTGSKFVKLLEQNREELLELVRNDPRLWRQSILALKRVLPIIQSHQNGRPRVFDEALVQRVDAVLGRLGERGSPKLRRALESIRQDLHPFVGKTMLDGLRAIDQSQHRK